MAFSLTTSAFQNGAPIPPKYTCEGEDVSPALKWDDIPAGTKSLALIMDDPDAPVGTWVHWIIYDLPSTLSGLPEGVAKNEVGPQGSKQGLGWGADSFSRVGYFGPCPPPGKPHRYYFKLYALDIFLQLPPKAGKPSLESKMQGHILGQATLIGTYQRKK